MKTRIATGAGLLLTIGSAVAGTFIYGAEKPASSNLDATHERAADRAALETTVTPEMIAMWKATASSSDYTAPRVPI